MRVNRGADVAFVHRAPPFPHIYVILKIFIIFLLCCAVFGVFFILTLASGGRVR